MLLRTIMPLLCEYEAFGDYVGPKTGEVGSGRGGAVELMKWSVQRWCDWLDALVHFDIHAAWHRLPELTDADPEKRELASLGVNQRWLGRMNAFSKDWWEWHHGEAAVRFEESEKWRTVGQAMAAQGERNWSYPDVDTVIISLWPLLKKNNWTYRDLLKVTRMILPAPHRYPLVCEPELATYCRNVLGLCKSGDKGRSSPQGKPRGWEVALKLCAQAKGSS
jgi:hypothetical protein